MILNINKGLLLEAVLPKLSKKEMEAEAKMDDKFKTNERFSDSDIQAEVKDMKKDVIETKGELMNSLSSVMDFVKGSNLKEIPNVKN